MMKKKGGRFVAAAAATIMAASSVVAFGGVANAAETITVYAPMTSGGLPSPYEKVVDLFNAKYPQYEAKIVFGPDATGYAPTLLTALQAGNGADIFKVAPGAGQKDSILPLAKAGFLADLTKTAAAKLNPKSLKGSFGGTKVYGLAMELTAGTLNVNMTLMEQDGIKAWPKTWAELINTCKIAVSKGHALIPYAYGFPGTTNMLGISLSQLTYGKDPLWSTKRAADKVTFVNDPGWREVLNRIVAMRDAGCFLKGGESVGNTSSYLLDNFINKRNTYILPAPGSFTNTLLADKAWTGTTLKVQPMPSSNAKDTMLMADVNYAFAMNSKTKKKAAATAFINFAASAAGQAGFQQVNGGLPMNGVSTKPGFSEIQPYLKAGRFFPNMLNTWTNAAVGDAYAKGVQALLLDRSTVTAVLQKMDRAW